MLRQYLTLFLCFILLLNSISLELVLIFSPSKAKIREQLIVHSETQELEFPCQFHDCSCTKESCLTDCCCKDNHDVFDELKSQAKNIENELSSKVASKSVAGFVTKVNFVKQLFCKQDKLKEKASLNPKQEIYTLLKNESKRLDYQNHVLICLGLNSYLNLLTQFINTPDCPPPNFS